MTVSADFSTMMFKRLFVTVAAAVLAACSSQQNQTQDGADTPAQPGQQLQPGTASTGSAFSSSSADAPAKPFVPMAPGIKVSSVRVPGKYVAITFDDGPSSSLTPQVLDILKRHGARATFFVQGVNAARNQSILARAVAEGHEIGNHTYSHIKMTGSSTERVCNEISRTNSIIESATGRKPSVMRPPYGAVNSSLVNLMYNQYGLKTIMWSVDTRDWQHPGVSVVVQRAVGGAKPGSIILLHDIHSSTLQAVEGIVTGLQARGYTLVTVSQLMGMGEAAARGASAQPAAESTVVVPGAGSAVIGG